MDVSAVTPRRPAETLASSPRTETVATASAGAALPQAEVQQTQVAPQSAEVGSLFGRPEPAEPQARQESQTVSESQVKEIAGLANQAIRASRSPSVQFQIEEKSGDVVVRVVDETTKEVIRQIPPEEILALRSRLEEMKGIIFNQVG